MAATITGISKLLVSFYCDVFSSAYGFYQAKDVPISAIELTAMGKGRIASAGLPETFTIIQSVDLIRITDALPQGGSFGEVCKYDWRGMPVAVKIMRVADPQKFVEEAQMMHRIQHTNCVSLYGVRLEPDPAIVMQWMGGGNLLQFLAKHPLPQIHRRLSLFRQVCAGLNSLHSHSPNPIIHSDLKPENILLDSAQKVAKIADFGLSKTKSTNYGGSKATGTHTYFAPEMVRGEVSSHRATDIYAMGLIFWEMLTLEHVWHGADGKPLNDFQLIAKYKTFERPCLDGLPPGLDPSVIALMKDCWAEDPDQRPTADQLWIRMSVLDVNNPDNNKPLIAYKDSWLALPCSFEKCLQKAVPPSTFQRLLLEFPTIEDKYREAPVQQVVKSCKLSEEEAKCIIIYTLESKDCPRDEQLYYLFCKAYRDRDDSALERFADFSFHFWNGLGKLPDHALELFRGLDKRLMDVSDLYEEKNDVYWHYPSSTTTNKAVASMFSGGGTLISFVGVTNAKSIQAFSLVSKEEEFMLMYTSAFQVAVALPSEKARLVGQFGSLPVNVDLVVLRAKQTLPPSSADHGRADSALAMLNQMHILQARYAGAASLDQFSAV